MIEFTDSQRRTVACGLTLLATSIVLAFVLFLGWLALKALSLAAAAVVPVVLGFFLALFFKPYYNWWKGRVRNPSLALAFMLVTVLVPLGVFVWYAGAVTVEQLTRFIGEAPVLLNKVVQSVETSFPRVHALLVQLGMEYTDLGRLYTEYGPTAVKASAGALKCLNLVLMALVTGIFFVCFLMTRDRRGSEIVAELPFLKDATKAFVAEQIDSFIDILVSFFQRQAVICLIEGIYYGLGFWLVGLPYGFMIGFVLGVMNLIPLFGSVCCLPLALPLAYVGAGGSTMRLLLVLGVWAFGQLLDGYCITPRIQGNSTGLGYAGVIFSFLFWSALLGPVLGMLLAIPLSAFCVVLWRSLKSRYLRPVV